MGTAVLVHGEGEAFEVEFVGYDGHTVALVTMENADVRPRRAAVLILAALRFKAV